MGLNDFSVFDGSNYLYIHQILGGERFKNELTVVVSPTVSDYRAPVNTKNQDLNKLLENSSSINPDFENMYEIVFDSYVNYSVTNESFDADFQGEYFTGTKVQVYLNSPFLNYAKECTISELVQVYENDQELLHYRIWSLNHILNVVTAKVPTFTKI